jgi:hypothetical protein
MKYIFVEIIRVNKEYLYFKAILRKKNEVEIIIKAKLVYKKY